MKPQNVIDHKHFFAFEDEEDVYGRFDACQTRDDGAGVWSPETGRWYPQTNYDEAQRVAEEMSKIYARTHN